MNRTIKDATARRFYYESHGQLRRHLADFISAYNFGRRLKTLKGLTPYEFICKAWASNPERFSINPLQQMPGLNSRGSRLVDEHQPLDVDLRLRRLPRRAFGGHVRPILLAGVRCFFERVMLRRSKKRQTTLATNCSPCALKRWSAISASVISGVALTRARISAAWLSIRAERRSPPCARASQASVLRHSLTSSIAVDGATRLQLADGSTGCRRPASIRNGSRSILRRQCRD